MATWHPQALVATPSHSSSCSVRPSVKSHGHPQVRLKGKPSHSSVTPQGHAQVLVGHAQVLVELLGTSAVSLTGLLSRSPPNRTASP